MGVLTDIVVANNSIGRKNLIDKGVEISESATNLEIMQKIADITSGGGKEYTNIVYNEDNTITLTDKDGAEHTIACTYDEAGTLVGLSYDGEAVELTYEGDNLIGVGNTEIDVSNAPLTKPVEILKVKTYEEIIYEHFGVNKAEYPCLFIVHNHTGFSTDDVEVNFSKTFAFNSSGTIMLTDYLTVNRSSSSQVYEDSIKCVVGFIFAYLSQSSLTSKESGWVNHSTGDITYTNTVIEELPNPDKYTLVMLEGGI